MTIRWLLILLVFPFGCSSTSSPSQVTQSREDAPLEKILHIRDIAGQTQEDIATILGHQSMLDAESAAKSGCAPCQKYSYRDGLVKIVYINDMADWITITPLDTLPALQTPALLGLSNTSPGYADERELRWTNYEGIRQISTFKRPDGSIEYIYMRVTTP